MKYSDPAFPPLLSATGIDESDDSFWRAAQLANRGKSGAGDVLWSRSNQRAELAIVLEPDVPLSQAQQLAAMSMVAMGDALGALCPPQVSVQFRWPGDIVINGARAGAVRLAADPCEPEDVPRWLVIGMSLQIVHEDNQKEPGEVLDRTCLVEEGIGAELTRSEIVQSIASYWMASLNNWLEEGLRGCHDRWLYRAIGRDEQFAISHDGQSHRGTVLGLDDRAGLLLKREDGEAVQCLSYAPYVQLLGDREKQAK